MHAISVLIETRGYEMEESKLSINEIVNVHHTPHANGGLMGVKASPKTDPVTVYEFTLPNRPVNAQEERSVMWRGPDPTGAGARSAAPEAGSLARGVTGGVKTPAGAALAGEPQALQATTGGQYSLSLGDAVTRKDGDDATTQSMIPTRPIEDWDGWFEQVKLAGRLLSHQLPGANDPLTESDVNYCKVIVGLGRALTRLNKADRKRRKDTPPSDKTLSDYQKKCSQIDREIDALAADEPEPLMTVMGRHAAKTQSFTAIKSALKWRAVQRVKELLKSQDAVQVTEGRGPAWMAHVHNLHRAISYYIEINALHRAECLDFTGLSSKKGRSKRADLPHLPDGWQDRFLDITAKDDRYNDVGVVLAYCGLRPVELAMGVTVCATDAGIAVHINGGKVRQTAGQPWRSFVLEPEAMPPAFVQRVCENGELTVSAEPDALRAYLGRLSDRVFLQGEFRAPGKHLKQYVLSAYTFRHALVTSLRQEGWETAAIAAVIGESSAATVSYYGTRSRQGAKPGRKTAVRRGSERTARPVRHLDMQGLAQLNANRKNPSKRSPSR